MRPFDLVVAKPIPFTSDMGMGVPVGRLGLLSVFTGTYRKTPIVVGWGIGAVRSGDIESAKLSPICQEVFKRVCALAGPDAKVMLYGVKRKRKLMERLQLALDEEKPQGVVILCEDSDLVDEVSRVMRPKWLQQ